MSFVLADRTAEATITTGTGTLDLAGAADTYQKFVDGVGDGNETYYCIVHRTEDEWEVGVGTVTDASPDTLSRDTILASSNSGSAVDLSAGTKDVFCAHNAVRTPYVDDDETVQIDSILKILERSSDPAEPAEGECIIWMSDGTSSQTGVADGDVVCASNAGGSTTVTIIHDHSAGAAWV